MDQKKKQKCKLAERILAMKGKYINMVNRTIKECIWPINARLKTTKQALNMSTNRKQITVETIKNIDIFIFMCK